MKVLEIKNNLVKIAYDVQDNLALSGFVVIQDANTPYVAQVMNLKADVTSNFAIVKLLFTFNEEGILKNYNGTIPSLKSTVTQLPANELLDIIPIEKPFKLGVLAEQDTILKVDKSILENNLLVCSNNTENTARLINNFSRQINEKIVIFDTEGTLGFDDTVSFGKDFKLPLNYDTINFIYDNELDDIDATSKAIIQDIFIEVQNYTKTLPEGYLPFDTFLNVVDQQYKETQIPQLVLLKNKLLKYKDLNIFAQTLKDVLSFSMALEQNNTQIVDISDMPPELQKEILTYSYKVMADMNIKIYSFVKVNNSNSSKKLLKTFLQRNNVFTTIICPHEYKYLNELKENAQNMILFAPLTLQHDFASYNTFLNKLNGDEYVVYGAHTQNIPLIAELEDTYTEEPQAMQEEEVKQEENPTHSDSAEEIYPQNTEPATAENITGPEITETPEIEEEPVIEEGVTDNIQPEISNEYPENIEYPDIAIEEPVNITETTEEPEITEDIISETPVIPNILADDEPEEETIINEIPIDNGEDTEISDIKVEPLYENDGEEELPETILTEEPDIDYSMDEIDVQGDFTDLSSSDTNEDDIVEQVVKDVDKAFYEKIENDDQISFDEPVTDELTEDDLNLIDDINAGTNGHQIELNEFAGDPPSVLPIYPAEDTDENETQNFEPGDKVSTPKYGEGVVEKMIKYGNKMLCSIEFPNIGRRLLDPSMSEITKLS